MYRLLFLVYLLSASLVTEAQKDTQRPLSKTTSNSDSALAKSLAEELKSVGVATNEKELDDITQAIAAGGQGAMSVAQYLLRSIAEIKKQQGNPSSQKKVELSERQVDNILEPLLKGKDSSLQLSRYLNVKLTGLKKVKPPAGLSSQQNQWLRNNYKRIGNMEKNKAAGEIRKEFTSIPEASLEYMISEASRLLKGDHREQLALLQQALSLLKAEKYSLMDRIEDKQLLLDKTDDLLKRNVIATEILNHKSILKKVEDDILKKEEEIRRIEAKS